MILSYRFRGLQIAFNMIVTAHNITNQKHFHYVLPFYGLPNSQNVKKKYIENCEKRYQMMH